MLYQKTFSKDYLSHKTVTNKDILPQWYWENDHPAIIKREQWEKAQERISAGDNKGGHAKIGSVKKRGIARVKSGALRGYFLIDMDWTKEERDQFIQIIRSIN